MISNQIHAKMADALCGLGILTSNCLNSDVSVMGFVPLSCFTWSPVRRTAVTNLGRKFKFEISQFLFVFLPSCDHIMIFFDINCIVRFMSGSSCCINTLWLWKKLPEKTVMWVNEFCTQVFLTNVQMVAFRILTICF